MRFPLFIGIAALAATAGSAQSTGTGWDAQSAINPDGITARGMDPDGQPCTPMGFNVGMTIYPACIAMGGPAPGVEDYPPCTRQRVDRCRQTYTRWTDRR